MKLFQQPHAFIQWVDGTQVDRSFDDEKQRQQFVSDCIKNDSRICALRLFYLPAPAGIGYRHTAVH